MLRTAVLVYGEYREFDIASKSWKFNNYPDYDIYISTWDKSIISNEKYCVDKIVENISEEKILKIFPNAVISIQPDTLSYLNNSEKAIFHWKTALKLIKDSNKKYDILFLTRTDNYIFEPIPMILFEHNVIYGLEEVEYINDVPFIQDIFFMGYFTTMYNMIDLISNRISSLHELPYEFERLNIKVKKIYQENGDILHMNTIRPNVRHLKFEDLTMSILHHTARIWDKK